MYLQNNNTYPKLTAVVPLILIALISFDFGSPRARSERRPWLTEHTKFTTRFSPSVGLAFHPNTLAASL
jgi:hypothetical protein